MKVIIGLGNPGRKYEDTRHNVGFLTIDKISREWSIPVTQNKFRALVGEGFIGTKKVLLVKPQTYMNLSGESVREVLTFYKLTPEDIVVIYDDLDLPVGKLRLRGKGSSGGHNGIKSIIAHLGTQEFNRIKVGIDRPGVGGSVSDYVLQSFPKADIPAVAEAIEKAAQACEAWTRDTFLNVMNKFNPGKES